MSVPFPRWREAIDAARDDAARVSLLNEVALWRARNLTDLVGQREATWAMSELASALNRMELAKSEARSLRSLCQSDPPASGEETAAAEALLARLEGRPGPGAARPPKAPRAPESRRPAPEARNERQVREPREPAEPRPPRQGRPTPATPPPADESPEARAVRLGRAGQWSEAFGTLKGRGGISADLIRVWLDLGHARAEGSEKFLSAAIQRLERLVPEIALASAAPEPRSEARPEPRPEARQRAEKTRPERGEDGPREQSLGELLAVVRAALAGDGVSAESLVPVVAPIRKLRELLDLASGLSGPDALDKLEALLLAVHRTAPPEARVLQGTTLALRAAGSGAEELARRLLIEGEAAGRLGGPGIHTLLPVAVAAQRAGWYLDRVLQGATRRERLDNGAIDVLASSMDGLWRLILRHGDTKAELWVVDHLPAEGRAAVAQLAMEPHRRLAVLPEGSELADSWASLGGPPAVTWPGDLGPALDNLR